MRNIAGKMASGRDYITTEFSCPDGAACTNQDKFFRHDLSCNSWENCGGKECCVKCTRGGALDPDGGSYNAACTEMCPKARAIYEKAKEKSKAKAERKKADSHSKAVRQCMADAQRLVRAAEAADLRDSDTVPNGYNGSIKIGTLRNIMRGEIPKGMSDFQLSEFIPFRTETLRKMAETLHCSADYLLGLVDEPCATVGGAMPEQQTVGCWMPGSTTPDHPCECYVMLDVSDTDMEKSTHRIKAYWTGVAFRHKPSAYAEEIPPFPVLAWLEIPEWKGGNGDA